MRCSPAWPNFLTSSKLISVAKHEQSSKHRFFNMKMSFLIYNSYQTVLFIYVQAAKKTSQHHELCDVCVASDKDSSLHTFARNASETQVVILCLGCLQYSTKHNMRVRFWCKTSTLFLFPLSPSITTCTFPPPHTPSPLPPGTFWLLREDDEEEGNRNIAPNMTLWYHNINFWYPQQYVVVP